MVNNGNMLKTAVNLLAIVCLLFALVTDLGSKTALSSSLTAKAGCSKCCAQPVSGCSTPNCCRVPHEGQNPADSSIPPRASNEMRVLSPPSFAVLLPICPLSPRATLRPILSFPQRPVPLFQRDCSYLI